MVIDIVLIDELPSKVRSIRCKMGVSEGLSSFEGHTGTLAGGASAARDDPGKARKKAPTKTAKMLFHVFIGVLQRCSGTRVDKVDVRRSQATAVPVYAKTDAAVKKTVGREIWIGSKAPCELKHTNPGSKDDQPNRVGRQEVQNVRGGANDARRWRARYGGAANRGKETSRIVPKPIPTLVQVVK